MQDRVIGRKIDLVAPYRDTAHAAVIRPARSGADPVFPQKLASLGVKSLYRIVSIAEKHNAIMDQRRRLVCATFIHRPNPLKLERFDVVAINLTERTVAPAGIVAPAHEPIAVRGMR